MKGRLTSLSNLKGFTLLEMIVSFALLALLLSLCYSVFSAALATKERIERETEERKQGEALFSLLRTYLEAAYFYQTEAPFLLKKKGKHLYLRWRVFTSPQVGKPPFPLWVHFATTSHPQDMTKSLLFFAKTQKKSPQRGELQEVLEGFSELRCSLWNGREWKEEWQEKTPPLLLKVELFLKKGQKTPYQLVYSFIKGTAHVARTR